jgi:MFS family permease
MLNKLWQLQRNFGLIGAGAFFIAGFSIALLNWQGAHFTISQHIALNTVSMVIFGFVNTVATTLIAICLFGYIARRWKFGKFFKVLSGILTTGLFLIGWFPDQFNNLASSVVHQVAALTVFTVAAVIVAIVGVLLWDRTSWVLKFTVIVFIIAGLFGVITASFFNEFFENNIFWIESFYMLAFYAFILSTVYSQDLKKGAMLRKYLHNFERWLDKLIYKHN